MRYVLKHVNNYILRQNNGGNALPSEKGERHHVRLSVHTNALLPSQAATRQRSIGGW